MVRSQNEAEVSSMTRTIEDIDGQSPTTTHTLAEIEGDPALSMPEYWRPSHGLIRLVNTVLPRAIAQAESAGDPDGELELVESPEQDRERAGSAHVSILGSGVEISFTGYAQPGSEGTVFDGPGTSPAPGGIITDATLTQFVDRNDSIGHITTIDTPAVAGQLADDRYRRMQFVGRVMSYVAGQLVIEQLMLTEE